MNEKELARMLGLTRLAVGVVGFLAPTKMVRMWIGEEAKPYPTNMILRGFAARDAAIGIGLLAALENDGPVRGWLEASAMSDLGDAVGTLAAWKDLPGLRRLLLLGAELGAAALGMQLAAELDD
ncbi:MAG TPA: hypothetical protein VEV82_00900 [Actinomycetota bacterium]|nr:hypothetical protein [Actinomycetota bacterium]